MPHLPGVLKRRLWFCTSALLQVLFKDLDLKCHVWLAELYSGGRLPVSVLCNATKLLAWFKTYDAQAADCPYTMWQQLSAVLSSAPAGDEGEVLLCNSGRSGGCWCDMLGRPLLAQPGHAIANSIESSWHFTGPSHGCLRWLLLTSAQEQR